MKLFVTFKQQNPDFEQKYADQYHASEESEGNQKNNWSETIKYEGEVDKISIIEEKTLKLTGNNDKTKPDLLLHNMMVLDCYIDDKVVSSFAASRELVEKTHKTYNEKYNTTRFYFYLKQRNDFHKLTDGIYVLNEDIHIS